MKPTLMISAPCLAFLALGAVAVTPAFADGEISFDDVPVAVMETAISTAPDLDFFRVSIETEGGRQIYEFEAWTPQGKHVEVDVFEDGTLDEVEMETSMDDVPANVRAALFEAQPGFDPRFIETSVRANGVFAYEFVGMTADGREIGIEIDEDGEVLEVSGAVAS